MRPILAQLLKVNLTSSIPDITRHQAFAEARKAASSLGAVRHYYGSPDGEPTHLSWVIFWPSSTSETITSQVQDLASSAVNSKSIQEWLIQFPHDAWPVRALEAQVCQLCTVQLRNLADAKKVSVANSLHKTYSDCFDAEDGGFTGGFWGSALNEPETNWYFLGWETRELHDLYAKTPLFDVEINALLPYMKGGWTHYVRMHKEEP